MVAGQPALTIWPVLLSRVSDSQQIAALLNALGYLQRIATNLAGHGMSPPNSITTMTNAGGNLMKIASQVYGDASQWSRTAALNGL